MSFRGKVKAILEDKKKGSVVTMAHPESQKAGTQGPEGAIRVTPEEVEAYKAKGWVPVKKSKVKEGLISRTGAGKPQNPQGHTRRPVYVGPNPTIADLVKMGQGSQIEGPKIKPKKSKRRSVESWEEKSKTTNENSNHPFYQKVKALSRGNKKNKSLLEKKSRSVRTFKILLGRVIPDEKKSKTDESLVGGAAAEVGAMGVRKLAQLWKDRKKSKPDVGAEDKKSKPFQKAKRKMPKQREEKPSFELMLAGKKEQIRLREIDKIRQQIKEDAVIKNPIVQGMMQLTVIQREKWHPQRGESDHEKVAPMIS